MRVLSAAAYASDHVILETNMLPRYFTTIVITLIASNQFVIKYFEVTASTPQLKPIERCNIIEDYEWARPYVIVGTCPNNRTGEAARRCLNPTLTAVGRIPVTNIDTGVTYRNIYCAICHGQPSDIRKWHMKLDCNSSTSLMNDCKSQLIKPYSVQLKPCHRKLRKRRENKLDNNKYKTEPKDNLPWAFGYTTLFNFGADGNTHYLLTSDIEEFLSKSECTEETQIFNPFTYECLQLSCPKSKLSLDGKCTETNSLKKDVSMVCVDFHIRYQLYQQFDQAEFEQNLVHMFSKEYNINPDDIIIPSKPYTKISQCPNSSPLKTDSFVWNASQVEGFYAKVPKFTVYPNGSNTDEIHLDCSDDNGFNLTEKVVMSLKFTGTHPKLQTLRDLIITDGQKSNTLPFIIKYQNDSLLSSGCISPVETQFIHRDWCHGIRNEYFNDEFELLTSANGNNITIVGIKVKINNKIYTPSQFQYTKVLNKGTLWRNITQMASTCDRLPSIKDERSCAKMKINHTQYETLSDRSIRIALFEEFSDLEMPFESEPRPHIKSTFTIDEYEYDWNNTDLSSTGSGPTLGEDLAIEICIPQELLNLLIELELWNRVNITPSCSYLKNFAHGSSITGFVFSSVSMLAMIAVLVTYIMFKSLRTLPGISLMNLTCAIMLSHISFLAALLVPTDLQDSKHICFIMAVLTHYCTLSSFMWMNVMAYSSYRSFGANLKTRLTKLNKKHLAFNSLYGWGIPALIVIVCVSIDIAYKEKQLIAYGVVSAIKVLNNGDSAGEIQIRYRTMSTCWIGNSKAAMVIFGAPMVYSMIVNLTLFIRTCYGMREPTQKGRPRTVLRRDSGSGHVKKRSEMAIHCRLSAQYGFAWIFGVVIIILGTSRAESTVVCYTLHILNLVFNILHGCTGLFIFFAFLFNKRILHLYRARLTSRSNTQQRSRQSNLTLSTSRLPSVSSLGSKISTSPIDEEPRIFTLHNNNEQDDQKPT